jgi:hypothetical protein
MATQKFDGVVDAVKYNGGQIQYVRAYERRGAAFSDLILLPRKDLLERLKQGRKFYTGRRREFLAGTFELGKPLHVSDRDGREWIATRPDPARDELEGVPGL